MQCTHVVPTIRYLLFVFSLVLIALPTKAYRGVVGASVTSSPLPATITVRSSADAGGTCPGGTCTLRQAIATAAAGDTIDFDMTTVTSPIVLTTAELAIDKNLTIAGPGAGLLTISGNGSFRGFDIAAGNFDVTISGLTISNSFGQPGGGILNSSTGTVNIADCTISGNGAVSGGGGIYNLTGVLGITNSRISGNTSQLGNGGGGVRNEIGTVNISNCTISSNWAGRGGGISNTGTGTVNIISSTLSNNRATANGNNGGGILNNGTGAVTVVNSTIAGNSAGLSGGGIYNASTGMVSIANSTIAGNSATNIPAEGGSPGFGGGVSNATTGVVTAKSTIIAGNIATTPAGQDAAGAFISQGYNLLGKSDSSTGFVNGANNDQVGTNATPLDPKLATLAHNGGATRTMALLPGSPGIDKGNSFGLSADQRGLSRPIDNPFIPNATGGDGSDIGAFEAACVLASGCPPPPSCFPSSPVASGPLTSGPVAWWPAEGDASDIRGGNNGTLQGTVAFTTGEVGQAFSFNGNGYVQVPNAPSLEPANLTIELWVRHYGTPGNYRYLVSKGFDNCAAASYAIYTGETAGLRFYVYDGVNFQNGLSRDAGAGVWDGNWHHIAGTYDGAVIRFYVDGEEMGIGTPASFSIAYNLPTDQKFYIGSSFIPPGPFCQGFDPRFIADVDEVTLYNRALTQAEIEGIYNAGGAGKCQCTLTCTANITQSNDLNQCGAVVTYPAPTTSGTCGTVTCLPASGSFFSVGTTTVTCSMPGGPSCSFTVTVNDTQAPVITCPANVSTSADPNQCSAAVNYSTPTVNDNCTGVGAPDCNPASGSAFAKGITTVSCMVSDASANSSNCSFTITVNDTQPPTVTCPTHIDAGTPQGQTCGVVNYTTPTANDNCSGATVNCAPASGICFPLGTTTVTCTATDASMNMGSCSFTVTVTEQVCTITCPANITKSNDPNQCGAVVTYTTPTPPQGCGMVTCAPASGSFFGKGTTTVTCSVAGGPSCSFTVTVNDTQPPAITCPANITRSTDPNQCSAVVSYSAPTVSDNCSGVGAASCNPASGSSFVKGTTTVTCNVMDASSNGSSCSFTVTVNDTQPPSITCPASITRSTDPNQCSAVVSYSAPTVSDNCSGVGAPTCNPASGSSFAKGTTTVTCNVMDASSNGSSCSFTVTVNDTQPPAITCPASITRRTDPNQCSAVVSYSAPTVSDNCSGVGAPTCSPASGSSFAKGTTTVTCNVMDAASNGSSCSFTITVNDTQPPAITCPAHMNATAATGQNCAMVSYTTPTANDNCSGATVNCAPASGTCFPIGTTTVTCTAMDASKNTGSCSFTVTVAPPCTISCPANITRGNDPNQCGAVVTFAPTTSGGGCGTVACSPASGSLFPKGTTTVMCSTTAGPSCSFMVTVNDTQPPTITCPANINIAAEATCPPTSSKVVSFAATASDNCPGVSVVCSPPSGSTFPIGTTMVTCNATDSSGNSSQCSFTVATFSACLVDLTNPGNVVLFNTLTGEYRFCCNGVLLATRRGVLTMRGCVGTIDDQKGDRKVHIGFDFSANNGHGAGTAALYLGGSTNPKCSIIDQSMAGNVCACPGSPPHAGQR
jgi:hypothetical protein